MSFIKLNKYKVNPIVFNKILKDYEWVVRKVSDLSEIINDPKRLDENRRIIYYDELNHSMICRYLVACCYTKQLIPDGYERQLILIADEVTETTEEMYQVPNAHEAKKFIYNILSDYYTEDEIDEQLNKFQADHQKPIHTSLPYYYNTNTVHKFTNCVYYDINNAHLDALTEIFPKAKRKLLGIRTKINNCKAAGDKLGARRLKDLVNIFVGALAKKIKDKLGHITGRNKYAATYEWIVKRTRNKLQNLIDYCNGEILYANTDGVIIHCAKNIIQTSNKLGDFKSELIDDIVYAYSYQPLDNNSTSYLIYQYTDNKGEKVIKGNCCLEYRSNIDLSTGTTIKYKKNRTATNAFEYTDLETEHKEIMTWEK